MSGAYMTYREQLAHPNWQRRRLERLQAADFTCQECGGTEVTLHVHHTRYMKGRKAWEYKDWELAVLCEPCHTQDHAVRESLSFFLALLPTYQLSRVAGYAAGVAMDANRDVVVAVRTFESAQGIADYVGSGVTPENVIDRLDDERSINGDVLETMSIDAFNASRTAKAA